MRPYRCVSLKMITAAQSKQRENGGAGGASATLNRQNAHVFEGPEKRGKSKNTFREQWQESVCVG